MATSFVFLLTVQQIAEALPKIISMQAGSSYDCKKTVFSFFDCTLQVTTPV
jgi:hypothetical protein